MMEKKIIVGGENLLEKAEEQEKMLEESAKELDDRKQKEVELRQALQEKEVRGGAEHVAWDAKYILGKYCRTNSKGDMIGLH